MSRRFKIHYTVAFHTQTFSGARVIEAECHHSASEAIKHDVAKDYRTSVDKVSIDDLSELS